MTVKRMDNVGIVVDDLQATIAFFAELGLELEGEAQVSGQFMDDCMGLEDAQCDIAMMRTPDGHSRLELAKYRRPPVLENGQPTQPHNTLGMHRVMFTVDDVEDVVKRLGEHGAELVGKIARYEDSYLLCYVRGPEGIFVGLAQELS